MTSVVRTEGKLRYSSEFLKKYEGREPNWGPLGAIVTARTYLRLREEEQRLETWTEACARVLEGNFNIIPDDPTATEEEMVFAYDMMWNLYWLPSGRALWISGTEFAERSGTALSNCWGVSAQPASYHEGGPKKCSFPFVLSADLLMLGGGVGFSVTDDVVDKFPKVRRQVKLAVVCDPNHTNVRELKAESIPPRDEDHTYIRVKDSRRGWTDAIRIVIDSHWKYGKYDYTLVLDVSDVRAAGMPIRGFGGTSSGPGPLVELLRDLNDLLNEAVGRKITPTDVLDCMNMIGRCVVAGNVRRSALLALGSVDNVEYREAKNDEEKMGKWRWASNNSVLVDDSFSDYEEIVETVKNNGEPGLINLYRGANYGRFIDGVQENIDKNVVITNPCSEIFLENAEPCNLAEFFPALCFRDGVDVVPIIGVATRFMKRTTFVKHEWEIITEVIERNRRIGLTLGGWEDFKMTLLEQGKSEEERISLVDEYYHAVKRADKEISAALGCAESIKLTATQPSGSKSNLNGSSPGRHAHYAKYYIRRVRFSVFDPMVTALKNLGFYSETENRTPNTLVFEFPVKAPFADSVHFKAASDYTLEEQMQDQLFLQTHWADNSVSSTLTFKKDEEDLIPDLLRKYKFKSTSLLPYSDHGYEQAPYEPISEEVYLERSALIKKWPNLADFRDAREQDILEADCEGGACPVR